MIEKDFDYVKELDSLRARLFLRIEEDPAFIAKLSQEVPVGLKALFNLIKPGCPPRKSTLIKIRGFLDRGK
jgi:hypothetical protein